MKNIRRGFYFQSKKPSLRAQSTVHQILNIYLIFKSHKYNPNSSSTTKRLATYFFSDGVSKLEDDETVTAKIASRDEAICPSMLTDRTFEPGGEKDMQGLKVGGGPVTTPSWRNPSCRFSNTILITRYSCRMEHLRPCISHCNSAGTSGSPSFHANESALHHIVPLTLHH